MGVCCSNPQVSPNVQLKKIDDRKGATDDDLMSNKVPNQYIEQSLSHKQKLEEKEENSVTLNDNDDAAAKKRLEKKKVQKIRGGMDEDEKIYENITMIPTKKKQKSDIMFIIKCLKSHFVFFNLAESELEYIVSQMFYCEVQANQYVFKQGDNASSYFILEKGSCAVIINDKAKKELKPGDAFGELALLYSAPRSASIKAKEVVGLWAIDRRTFRKAVEEMVSKEYEENRKFIENIKFFQFMTMDQRDAIARVLITHKFAPGDNIVNEGDPASSYYIIKDGTVSVLKGAKELRKMYKGESFGEQALYFNTTRGCSVKAVEEVKCIALGRETLTNILGDKVQIITFRNIQKWAFEKSNVLSKLTKIQTEKILENMTIQNFKNGDVIIRKGDKCSKLWVVLNGSANFGQKEILQGVAFGDEFLKEENQAKKVDNDIVMNGEGVMSSISFASFFTCIGGKLEEIIIKNEKSHEKQMVKTVERKDTSGIKLEELIYIKKLGFGQFGSVYLTKDKKSNEIYALKCVAKAQIIEQNLEKHLMQEKQVMEKIQFPFIMQFIRTFQDANSVYFLDEYVRGMELFDVIRDIGLLNTFDSQFYIGALLLALEYLHSSYIIYRDIKPENLMVDDKGYLKMIDLGTAKILNPKTGSRTFTIIGTPHYMAPEIITGKGYSFNVDLWSVGIVLYEFMCGGVPFAEEADDPYEIYEEIIKKTLTFPSFLKDKKAKKLMTQLLNKVPDLRLGGSYAALKANDWFDKFDWDKLFNKELKPPYLPPKEKLVSESEFRKMFEQKKLVVDEIKLDDSKGKYKKENAKDPNWDKDF